MSETTMTDQATTSATNGQPVAGRGAESEWLDVRGAARHLNIGPGSVYQAVAARKLRHVRVGNRRHGILRFKRAWLDDYFERLAGGVEVPERR